jgi:hypothetical protein
MESGYPLHLLDVLCNHNVPFVIIGDHAVAHHGFVRATEDTDIVFRRTPESELSLLDALAEVSACWIGNEIDPDTAVERTFPVSLSYIRRSHIMMLVTDFGFLDIFDYIPGHPDEPVEQLFETAAEHEQYKYVSLQWLRTMKATANRPKDQIDLENLPAD